MTLQVVPEAASTPATTTTRHDRTAYLANLVQRSRRAESQPAWLEILSDRALALLSEQAWPSTKQEDWRFTNLSPLLDIEFVPAPVATVTVEELQTVQLAEAKTQLVIVNGRYAADLSTLGELPDGTLIGNLTELVTGTEGDRLSSTFGQIAPLAEVFTALNTVGFTDPVVIQVPRNQVVTTLIQVIYVSTGEQPSLVQPRLLAIAETNAEFTLVEDFLTLGETAHLTNSVTELVLGENAQINHSRIQREAAQSFHIGTTAVQQARDSRYVSTAVSFGAQICRHNVEVGQVGVQTETTLNGLTVIQGEQIADTHSAIAFAHPYSTADQLHKCIVDDRAHAVFNGKILVPHAAQQTNASQLNRNLLLSPKAQVDTKPQLEIVADNVKCAHGATISQLEADEVFYLQSRGINQAQAERLLIYAFAQEVIQQIPVPSLRESLTRWVTDHTDA